VQQEYGEWVERALAIYHPVFLEVQAVQAAHAAEQALPIGRRLALLRPRADRFLTMLSSAEAQITALQPPRIASLDVAPELRPTALASELKGAMGAVRTIVSGMVDTLDHAAGGRLEALEQSARHVMQAINRLTRTQLRLAEARMNALPPEYPGRYVVGAELGGQKLARLLLASNGETTPTLGRDLLALASEIEGWMDAGLRAAEQQERSLTALSPSQTAELILVRRLVSILPHQRVQLGIGRELAALIRQIAGELKGAGLQNRLLAHMGTVRTMMSRLIEQERTIASVFAAPQ
jgi:hypothetical protein